MTLVESLKDYASIRAASEGGSPTDFIEWEAAVELDRLHDEVISLGLTVTHLQEALNSKRSG